MTNWDYLTGIYNITPTPFTPDGGLDEESLRQLTEFTIRQGVQGMTILGVLGEADKLTEIERDMVVATVVEAADGRIPICVGTSHGATYPCVAYSRRAEALGAKAIMVAPPKLARPNAEALRRHYLTVAESVSVPVVVQDHPTSSGVPLTVEFIAALADESPQCRFLKLEDEPSPPKVSQVRAANPTISIFGGLGGIMFLEELQRGAVGTMTGFAFPELLVAIYQHYQAGELARAAEVFYRYLPLIRFENQPGINLTLRKEVYALRGVIAFPTAREPYRRVDAGTLEELRNLLARLGLLEVHA